jgi:hypothetical protein
MRIWNNVTENDPFSLTILSRRLKEQPGAWRNGTSFCLNDLEVFMTVVFEAKEWMTAHPLKRFTEKPPVLRGFL